MKTRLLCLALAAFVFPSCDKSGEPVNETAVPNTRPQPRAHGPVPTATPAPATPAPTAPTAPAESLTAAEMIENFRAAGIPGLPKDVADGILAKAAEISAEDDQLRHIQEQAAAWQHLRAFQENEQPMPDHMKRALLENLSQKHGESWQNMATELDEQIAASNKVMELRLNGIPGMSSEESDDFIIQAIEKHGANYKVILAEALARAQP